MRKLGTRAKWEGGKAYFWWVSQVNESSMISTWVNEVKEPSKRYRGYSYVRKTWKRSIYEWVSCQSQVIYIEPNEKDQQGIQVGESDERVRRESQVRRTHLPEWAYTRWWQPGRTQWAGWAWSTSSWPRVVESRIPSVFPVAAAVTKNTHGTRYITVLPFVLDRIAICYSLNYTHNEWI